MSEVDTQGTPSQSEASTAAEARGKHASRQEAEGSTQASTRQREAYKPAGGRGRHAHERKEQGRNTRELRDKSTKQDSHRQSIGESKAE